MNTFQLLIAGRVAAVSCLFESTRDYCRAYLTEGTPDFSISVLPADLVFEQAAADEEAREEGLRLRKFSDPFLERAAIQRKLAEHLFRSNTLLFHGSTVAVDGEAYLFTARCGTGKSTHTRLWMQAFGNRAVMVNDDKPFLQLDEDRVWLYGSPWSGKHGLDANIRVPLKGLCILERGAENRIARISAAEALPMLQKQAYRPLEEHKETAFLQLVDRLSQAVPLWKMACNKNPDAAHIAFEAMHK